MSSHEPLAGILLNLHVYLIGAHHRMVCVVRGHLISLKTILDLPDAFLQVNLCVISHLTSV